MSFPENRENVPDHHLFEAAKDKSSLLKAFFKPHKDLKAWERALYEQVSPFGQLLIEVKGRKEVELTLLLIQNDFLTEEVINLDTLSNEALTQTKVIGLGIFQMGYEANDGPTVAAIVQPVKHKLGELTSAIDGMIESPGLERVVRRTLAIGTSHRVMYPEIYPHIYHPPVDLTLHEWEQQAGHPFRSIYKREPGM